MKLKKLEEENKNKAHYETEEKVIEAVCDATEIDIPSGMVETEIDNMLKDIETRLNRLEYEESKIGIYDYVLKNNNLEKTVDIIMDIIKHESCDEVNDF